MPAAMATTTDAAMMALSRRFRLIAFMSFAFGPRSLEARDVIVGFIISLDSTTD
jgi:hypothetical protein